MSTDLIAIKGSKLPAHLVGKGEIANPFAAAVSEGGFPVVSIKGKVFHIQRGDERTLVTKPGDEDPAGSLEVIILSANPNRSKVYYEHGYEEGSTDKPDCYSNNGLKPEADAENPQCKTCAACPHNQWGSRITENGAKAKECSDSMRIAICPAGQINDPMLLRVPATSLKPLGLYGTQLAKRGLMAHHVVTKISFDHSVAHPALIFKAVSYVDEDQLAEIEACQSEEADTIRNITGMAATPGTSESEAKADDAPVEKTAKKRASKKAAKPKPKEVADEVEEETAEVEEETAEVEEETAPAKKAAKKATIVEEDEIDAALDDLDWDDE